MYPVSLASVSYPIADTLRGPIATQCLLKGNSLGLPCNIRVDSAQYWYNGSYRDLQLGSVSTCGNKKTDSPEPEPEYHWICSECENSNEHWRGSCSDCHHKKCAECHTYIKDPIRDSIASLAQVLVPLRSCNETLAVNAAIHPWISLAASWVCCVCGELNSEAVDVACLGCGHQRCQKRCS